LGMGTATPKVRETLKQSQQNRKKAGLWGGEKQKVSAGWLGSSVLMDALSSDLNDALDNQPIFWRTFELDSDWNDSCVVCDRNC
jgi:hypothetical protein